MDVKKEDQLIKNKQNRDIVTGDKSDPSSQPKRYTHIEAAERSNAKLYEVHSVMENELLRMRKVNDTLFDTSQKLNKTNTIYDKYGENLTQNRSILKIIQFISKSFIYYLIGVYRTQIMQNIIENIAMYFFFAVCLFIFWERFYIWELLTVFRDVANVEIENFTNDQFKQNV